MSRETRTIRPFVGLGDIGAVLEETALHFGTETCLAGQGITIDVSPHEFLMRPVTIEWAADDTGLQEFTDRAREAVKAAGLSDSDLSLVAVASSPFLKVADIIFERTFAHLEELGRITDLSPAPRPDAFSAPFSGFTVDAYVLLNRQLEKRPLRPYLRGTWLAHARYRVSTTHGPAFLPPTPLTAAIRDRLGLASKAVRYLYLGDHDLLKDYTTQEKPTFYVDEDLLSQLNARRRSRGSKALQLQLAHDFAASVVRRAAGHEEIREVAYDDITDSLLGSVLRIAAGPGATDEDMNLLVSELRRDVDRVVGRLEHYIDLASGYRGVLEEEDS